MNTIDFSTLPPPSVVETISFESILAAMRADLVARDPAFTALVESDPAMKILEVCAYRETLLRQRVNDAAKSVMLAYAVGADLDQLAALYNVERKVITPADDSTIPPTEAVMEADADFRRRVLLSLDGLATAGAKNAYIYHALSVVGVRDAAVVAPPIEGVSAGRVEVYILADTENGAASSVLLSAVESALNAETVRPLTDIVSVHAATIKDYTISASLYVYPGPDAAVVLANAQAAAGKYTSENFRLGRDITMSGLYAALHASGVQRVELAEPSATIVNGPGECAHCTEITVTLAGTDE